MGKSQKTPVNIKNKNRLWCGTPSSSNRNNEQSYNAKYLEKYAKVLSYLHKMEESEFDIMISSSKVVSRAK